MNTWQMQEAQARLTELIEQAASNGAQKITVQGQAVAVVLSAEDYARITSTSESLVDFMQRSPLHDLEDLEFPRDRNLVRDSAL